jgi:hypothetical protein
MGDRTQRIGCCDTIPSVDCRDDGHSMGSGMFENGFDYGQRSIVGGGDEIQFGARLAINDQGDAVIGRDQYV